MARKPYPSDVTDEEWEFVAPYLTLMMENAPQREHDLREVFNGMRWIVRTGSAWRYMPNDLPPWEAVYQQSRRWLAAGVFEAMTQDLRRILRVLVRRHEEPSAAIFDSRTLRSTLLATCVPQWQCGQRVSDGCNNVCVQALSANP